MKSIMEMNKTEVKNMLFLNLNILDDLMQDKPEIAELCDEVYNDLDAVRFKLDNDFESQKNYIRMTLKYFYKRISLIN